MAKHGHVDDAGRAEINADGKARVGRCGGVADACKARVNGRVAKRYGALRISENLNDNRAGKGQACHKEGKYLHCGRGFELKKGVWGGREGLRPRHEQRAGATQKMQHSL